MPNGIAVKKERPPLVQITPKALEHMHVLMAQKAPSPMGIKITLKTRGCSGLQWTMSYAEEANAFDEKIQADSNTTIFVDPKAILYIIGTTIDFQENDVEKGFVFINPNEKSKCGCGESFNV